VEFREACAFEDVLTDGDGVTGVRLRTSGGGRCTERARLVVGADGMRSTVAARIGAPTLVEHPRRTCVYYTYWPGLTDTFEIYQGANQWVGAMPTNDGATGVAAYFPQSRFAEVRTDAMNAYLDNIRTVAPGLFARMSDAVTSGTSSARRPAPAGHWSATRRTTRTRSPRGASRRRSRRPNCWSTC
jgi:2-polyprenyl-6-methoxyphenol hydroxylase-like FAD-dependent oxidoreductase